MKRFFIFMLCAFLCVWTANAQSTKVTGHVSSADDGQPLIGASVVVKGTTIGVQSDLDGNFTIMAPKGSTTLIVYYIGMKTQEIPVAATLDVKMSPDTQSLDEVVVTALGISREKKALGYAVQDVKSDVLNQASSNNLASALQGKVSGVEIQQSSGMPGASAKITIRGSRSFTGDNTPLYVVDGMPVASSADVSTGNSVTGSDFANRSVDIDPNDIESINILKGQAASALYGMRASNGVVVITTKSGKGASKGKPQITLNSSVTFDKMSVVPAVQTEYAQGSNGVYKPTASTSWGCLITDLANDATYGGNTDNKYTKAGKHEGMYYVLQRAKAGLDPWAKPQVYDNINTFFKTGFTWSNAANVQQAMDRGSYSFSLGNTHSTGVVPSTGMDRYNAKMAATANLSSNWTTGFTGNFVKSTISKQTSANNGIVATVYPAPSSYDLAGIPSNIDGDLYTQNTYRSTSGFDAAYWAIKNNKFTEKSQRFFGNAFLQYATNLNRDDMKLTLKYQLGDDAYVTNYTDSWGYGHSNGTGEIDHFDYTINELNSLFTAAYQWTINPELTLDALYGNEIVQNSSEYIEAYGSNYNMSGWNHIGNASNYQAAESYYQHRTVGNFGSISLAWKDMLYFNATGRQDIVSSMPRGNRTFFYPSVSLGWIFTQLESLKNDILTYGKLRLSYAEVGMAGSYIASYYSVPGYGGGFSSGTPITYPIDGVVAYTPNSTVYDTGLMPQNTRSYEVGTDLTFFNGRLSFSYTFSRQNVKNQIFGVPLAGSTGYGELMTNGGSVHTNAHEITLGIVPVETKNFKWNIGLNFSKIDNYVDKLAEGVTSIFLGGFTEPQVRAGIGYKYPVIYGVSYLRNDAGQLILDSNGLPQAGEEKVIGTVSPDFILGISTDFDIYKLHIAAVFDWKQGGQMYAATSGMMDYYGMSKKSGDYRDMKSFVVDGVQDNGDGTYTKNTTAIYGSKADATAAGAACAQDYFAACNDISESMIANTSFVKLRELSLSYPVLDKSWLKVNLNCFARNLIIWSQLKNQDPEASQGNNNMSGAFERFSLPGTSSFGMGLNIKF
jgi:TonB-linked SusC/RagA family outer membrane protein